MRRLLLITLLTAVTPCVYAQRMLSASPHFARSYHRGGHAHSFFDPLAFYDPFYLDDLSSTRYAVASQPRVVVVQTSPATAPVPEPSSPPTQPLMIELQGDRYVRVSGEETSGTQMINPMPDAPRLQERPAGEAISPAVANELVPAVLVFRDGHHEEVSDYTITDGVLYTRSDYYTNGTWNRRIELSTLNLPETLKSNQSRGVRFQLPSAPNEVIVGP